MVERNPELKSILEELETQYDTQQKLAEEPILPLSPEVERFLRELDQEGDEV